MKFFLTILPMVSMFGVMSQVMDAGNGVQLWLDADNVTYTVRVKNQTWFTSDTYQPVNYFGIMPQLVGTKSGKSSITWLWADDKNKTLPWETTFLIDPEVPGMVVFRQTFTLGVVNTIPQWPSNLCSPVVEHMDQTGGKLLKHVWNISQSECCAQCLSNHNCNAFVMEYPINETLSQCFLISGAKGTKIRQNRILGRINRNHAGDQNSVLAGFPSFAQGVADLTLNSINFGGCQLQSTNIQRWTNIGAQGTASSGIPILLYSESGRAVMMAPNENFFVALHSSKIPGIFQAGIKASVRSIPKGFSHDTVIFSTPGGINATLVAWGDMLLNHGGQRQRVNPYSDFVLSHLGHWNDAGAFYYHYKSKYSTYEDALLAVKKDAEHRNIPFRYSQWDDWWAYQKGDWGKDGGLVRWWPRPDAFPSGLTDWLGLPLSLYAPGYSASNVYRADYNWVVDSGHGLPIDKKFYTDIFRNGTKAGMVMFEQDFLCSINVDSNLTNQDVHTGQTWFHLMNEAAEEANITLQLCMMNPIHSLASTLMSKVTNGRATRDNHPGTDRTSPANGIVIGLSGMLHYAVGIWPSRDNVRTNSSDDGHEGPEPMPKTQTLLALLAGGPYGPSDSAGSTNRSLVMRSCREDGVLLRADKPITMLDKALTSVNFNISSTKVKAINVWSTFSQIGNLRWGYVLAVNTDNTFSITPQDILPSASKKFQMLAWEYWGGATNRTFLVSSAHPLTLPACPPPSNPAVIKSAYYILAPVLSNNWSYLGEPGKIVSASSHRVASVRPIAHNGIIIDLIGSPGEKIVGAVYSGNSEEVILAKCIFPKCGDVDCEITIKCNDGNGCSCSP